VKGYHRLGRPLPGPILAVLVAVVAVFDSGPFPGLQVGLITPPGAVLLASLERKQRFGKIPVGGLVACRF